MDLNAVLKMFTCQICKEMLHSPKHLSCNHDVCEKCLDAYIIRTVPMSGYDLHEFTGGKNVEVKPLQDFFVCPADGCDEQYRLKHPHKNTIHWASMANNGIRKTHFMELFHGKRKNDTKCCDVCNGSVQAEIATDVCTNCLRLYCVKCTFMHRQFNPAHNVVDVDVFENASTLINNTNAEHCAQDISHRSSDQKENQHLANDGGHNKNEASVNNGSSTNRPSFVPLKASAQVDKSQCIALDVCPLHKPCEKVVFCKDCVVACCIKCRDTLHTACKHVHSVHTMAKTLLTKELDKTLKDRIENINERCSESLRRFILFEDRIREFIEAEQVEMVDKVAELQNKISSMVRSLEYLYTRVKKCLTQIDKLNAQNPAKFIKTFIHVEKESLKLEDELAKLLKGKEEDVEKLVEELNESQNKDKATCSSKDTDKTNNIGTYKNHPMNSLLHYKHDVDSDVIDARDDVEWEMDILAKSSSDVFDCWLKDCLVLRNKDIIVADHANRKVKLVHDQKIVQEVQLECSPSGLAVDDKEEECFVSLRAKHKVIVLSIRCNKLFLSLEIITDTPVHGIAVLNDGSLLITNISKEGSNGPICVLHRNGNMDNLQIRNISPGKSMYIHPRYIKVVIGDILKVYGTDFQRNTLSSFELSEESHLGTRENRENKTPKTGTGNETHKDSNMCVAHSNGDTTLDLEKYITDPATIGMQEEITNNENTASDGTDNEKVIREHNAEVSDQQRRSTNSQNLNIWESFDESPNSGYQQELSLGYVSETDVQYPTGFDVDEMGNIFVCSNSDCKIIRLDKDGKQRFRMLDVPLPRALRVKDNRMFVTVDSGVKKNFIMVFKLKDKDEI